MPLELTRDAEEFAARAGDFLSASPERNVLATTLHVARALGGYGPEPPLFALHAPTAAAPVSAAALRTPPWPMLATGFDQPGAAGELIGRWLEHDPEPLGVGALPATARAIAAAYAEQTGARAELEMLQGMLILDEVDDPPRPASGALRRAAAADRDLLVDWELGFLNDAHEGPDSRPDPGRTVDRRLNAGFQYLWIAPGGSPVATVAHNQPIAGIARIGPVYTPPEHRNRGYGSAATAALSRLLLAGPAKRCMLLTDLANPTSNKIYQSIGYARFADWEKLRFRSPDRANALPAC